MNSEEQKKLLIESDIERLKRSMSLIHTKNIEKVNETPQIKKMIERNWDNLILIGNTGTGKTQAAIYMIYKMIQRFRFLTFGLLKAYDISSSGFDGRIDELIKYDVLIIDDVGTEKPTEYTESQYNKIIDYRHDNLKKTIVTTNLGIEELKVYLGDRAVSRLRVNGMVIDFGNKDLRS